MTALKELQAAFTAYMLQDNERILNDIITPAADAELRMDVYRNGYYLRLIDILAMDYVALKKWLGETSFIELATEYIDAFPSDQFSIRVFGRHLSKFLAKQVPAKPILTELAAFEWQVAETIDAADASQITFAEVAKIPPENWGEMKFILHPSVKYLPFSTNAPEIWRALKHEETGLEVATIEESINWLFWRFNHEAYFHPLDAAQLAMLQAIERGKNFGGICEDLTEYFAEEAEVIQFAAATMRGWVEQGIFADINI